MVVKKLDMAKDVFDSMPYLEGEKIIMRKVMMHLQRLAKFTLESMFMYALIGMQIHQKKTHRIADFLFYPSFYIQDNG